MSTEYSQKLLEIKRKEAIEKILTTDEPITGYETRGNCSWGISAKNHYKCYSCGAYSYEDSSQIHKQQIGKKCSGTFSRY